MGAKGGGARVGFGSATNKGPKNLGGKFNAGGKVTGGGTSATLRRIAGGDPKGLHVSISNFARQAGLPIGEALAAVDRLVGAGEAKYTYLAANAASVLKAHGQSVPERDGKPVRGFTVV